MNDTIAKSTIALTVPAHSSMMLVIRMTTAGVLGRSGLTVDGMDDIKMAAEEACNCLIRSSGCAQLQVRYNIVEGEFILHIEAFACECGKNPQISTDEIAVIRCVLLSMVDDVELVFDDKQLRAVELRKRLPQ